MSGPYCPHGALTVSECPTCRAPKTIRRKSIPELRHILETHTSDLIFTEYARDLLAHYERLEKAAKNIDGNVAVGETKDFVVPRWAIMELKDALSASDQPPEDMVP